PATRDELEAAGQAGFDIFDSQQLRAFDDPAGPGAKAVADSAEHDLKAGLDKAASADPAIIDRQRQEADLKAKSPLQAKAEQDGTMGLGLFDKADEPTFRLDDGDERPIADILKEIEADEAAIAAA